MSTVVESTVSLSRASARRFAEAPRDDHLLPFDAVLQGSNRLSTLLPTASAAPRPSSDDGNRSIPRRSERPGDAAGSQSESARTALSATEESSASRGDVGPVERRDDADSFIAGEEAASEPAAASGVTDKSSPNRDDEAGSPDAAADVPQPAPRAGEARHDNATGAAAEDDQTAAQRDPLANEAPAGDRDVVDESTEQATGDNTTDQRKSGRTHASGITDLPPDKQRNRVEQTEQTEQTGEAGSDRAEAAAGRAADLQRIGLSTPDGEVHPGGADAAAATAKKRRVSRETAAATSRSHHATKHDGDAGLALLDANSETARQQPTILNNTFATSALTETSAAEPTADDPGAKIPDGEPRADATTPSAGTGARQDASQRLGSVARVETDAANGRGQLGPGDAHRFVQRVSRAIELAHHRGESLRIRLSPPELGTLRVEIAIRSGVLSAQLEADSAAARAALLDNLPLLRDRLAEQQIRVDRFDVNIRDDAEGHNGGGSSSFAFQDAPGEGAGWRPARRPSALRPGQPEPAAAPRIPAWFGDGQLNLLV